MDRKQGFLKRADEIIKKLESILDEDYEDRIEKISDCNLKSMLRLINERKMMVETNKLPPRDIRYHSLAHIIIDQWPLGTSLGDEIIELEDYYVTL